MNILEKKHLMLLGVTLLMLGMQPFAHGFLYGFVFFDLIAVIATLGVLLVVFDHHRERLFMFAVAIPAVISNTLLHFEATKYQTACSIVYHGFAAAFFGAAVAVILHNAFRRQAITMDQIVAGINGFLIAGVAWGNLFLMIELIEPGSFKMSERAAAEMADQHSRRFEFNHVSFAILSGLGFDEITPAGRLARTLSWIEASFGLFYMAVIIGLLVGLKMATVTSSPIQEKSREGTS